MTKLVGFELVLSEITDCRIGECAYDSWLITSLFYLSMLVKDYASKRFYLFILLLMINTY